MPALSQAWERGKSAQCLNNLKQSVYEAKLGEFYLADPDQALYPAVSPVNNGGKLSKGMMERK